MFESFGAMPLPSGSVVFVALDRVKLSAAYQVGLPR
jgi:hypothetical protein